VAFLDSDDEWMCFHLEKAIYYLTKYPDKIDLMTANPLRKNYLTGEISKYDILDLSKYNYFRLEEAYVFNLDTLFDTTLRNRIITTQTIVCKKEIATKFQYDENLPIFSDCLHPLEIAYHRVKIAHLQEYHVIHWAHRKNLVNWAGIKTQEELIKISLVEEKFYLAILKNFILTDAQEKMIKSKFSEYYFWTLGYRYFRIKDYKKMKEFF